MEVEILHELRETNAALNWLCRLLTDIIERLKTGMVVFIIASGVLSLMGVCIFVLNVLILFRNLYTP